MVPNSPVATFTVESIGDIPDGLYSGETINRQLAGSLNIRDADVPLNFDIEVRLDGDLLLVLGRTSFTWEQFGLSVRPLGR